MGPIVAITRPAASDSQRLTAWPIPNTTTASMEQRTTHSIAGVRLFSQLLGDLTQLQTIVAKCIEGVESETEPCSIKEY